MELSQRITLLADRAAGLVEPSNRVGLGSGSTAEAFVRSLGDRVHNGLAMTGVATSSATQRLAESLGIQLTSIDEVAALDLGVDGADEIDPRLNLTKGRGGALLFEKLVARSCRRFIIVAAAEKLVPRLGMRVPLPVEIVPFAWRHTADALRDLGLTPTLRRGDATTDGLPYLTDGGHFILDCHTGPIDDPSVLADRIKSIAGVVDHGLFVGLATDCLVVTPDGVVEQFTRATPRE